jgi:hypothetical protein
MTTFPDIMSFTHVSPPAADIDAHFFVTFYQQGPVLVAMLHRTLLANDAAAHLRDNLFHHATTWEVCTVAIAHPHSSLGSQIEVLLVIGL